MKKKCIVILICIINISFCRWVYAEKVPDFVKEIRPILSDKCFYCHGPDSSHRKADLRLDQEVEALKAVSSGEFMKRINHPDADTKMPPPESNLILTEKEKQQLAAWIAGGAKYSNHWAFVPLPDKVTVPDCKNTAWSRQELDKFILNELEKNNLEPNPDASPVRWMRRVTLDLTGLPPSLEQIKTFNEDLQKHGETAYESYVNNLLASPAYGEHLATYWLDLARYADSYGYQSDKLNNQWPYRDWVIKAFNDNLSYDQFITWQLAGDLLPNPSHEQRLATAFNRLHRLNNEGGAVFEEWRQENVADRVHTFGTVVLGLTMECCRCHDHKYDPIPMKEYYSLSAFFNSIDESGVYDNVVKVPSPTMLLPTPDQFVKLHKAQEVLADLEKQYETIASVVIDEITLNKSKQMISKDEIPDQAIALSFDKAYDDSLKDIYHFSVVNQNYTRVEDCLIPRINHSITADMQGQTEEVARLALSLDGDGGVAIKGIAPLDRWKPFTIVSTFKETKRDQVPRVIMQQTQGTDCGYNGFDLMINNGFLETKIARDWPGNAIAIRSVNQIPHNQWIQLAVTYDGSSKANGFQIYLNGEVFPTQLLQDHVKKSATVNAGFGGELVIGQRFRDRGFIGGQVDDIRVYYRELTREEIKALSTNEPVKSSLSTYYSAQHPGLREIKAKITEARKEVVIAEEAMFEIPIMEEMATPRETHILARGQYDAPRNEKTRINRDVPACLSIPFPKDVPNNRLGLAKWVTDPHHPLTARVAVNRIWGIFFAEPLVRTPENFGSQSELPSHPELMDWISREFINSGWDVKKLCKIIVLSATYRQDSVTNPERLEIDPTNRLLSRGTVHRLSAEQIRDLALFASELYQDTPGGPPVYPYQPGKDLWRESNGMSPPYQQQVGKALYRRSVYSVWKRTAPLPNMLAFDSTAREVCTVKRSRTNTPLQALVLLNDVQFVEASRALAQKLIEQPEPQLRIDQAFLRLTSRLPDKFESESLLQMATQELAFFQENPEEAKRLVAFGDSKIPTNSNIPELAAWTTVCQIILNLDATIWKR